MLPPEGFIVAVPLEFPQVALVELELKNIVDEVLDILICLITVHPAASVTVTEYCPAQRFVLVAVFPPLLQVYV